MVRASHAVWEEVVMDLALGKASLDPPSPILSVSNHQNMGGL
jgi:hypothetical protein